MKLFPLYKDLCLKLVTLKTLSLFRRKSRWHRLHPSKKRRSSLDTPPQINGRPLPYSLELPKGHVDKVIIFAHGSGPQNMDGDLSSISLPEGTTNLIYKDISSSLRTHGFATLWFDKRSFAIQAVIKEDSDYINSSEFKNFVKDPMQFFYDDLIGFAKLASKQYPSAKRVISESCGLLKSLA